MRIISSFKDYYDNSGIYKVHRKLKLAILFDKLHPGYKLILNRLGFKNRVGLLNTPTHLLERLQSLLPAQF